MMDRISAPEDWIVQLTRPVLKSSPTAAGRIAVEILVPRHGNWGIRVLMAISSMKLKHPLSSPPSYIPLLATPFLLSSSLNAIFLTSAGDFSGYFRRI